MKLNKYLMLSLVMTATGALCACGDDEEEDVTPVVDVRDQAVGEYEGECTYNIYCGGTLYTWGTSEKGSANVTKNGSNAMSVAIDSESIVISKIAEANNGFAGDIESETKTNGYIWAGYKGISLSGEGSTTEMYSAAYFTESQQLEFYISTSVEAAFEQDDTQDVKVATIASLTNLSEEEVAANWGSMQYVLGYKFIKK